MSEVAGFGGARVTNPEAAAGPERSAPQVYHDAVLASQQPVGAAADDVTAAMPPLVAPPIDPALRGAAEAGSRTGQRERPQPPQRAEASIPAQRQSPAGPQFPVAKVFDGTKPDGSPLIARPNLDPREIPALVAYLTRAPLALSAPGTTRDEVVASAPASVPRAFHTDGTWAWPAAVGYYLSLYHLPPQPELVEHIRSRRYTLGPPAQPQVVQAVASQILAMLNTRPQQHAEQRQAGQQQERPQIPARPPRQQLQPGRPGVARLPAFSAAFNAAGNRHAAWVTEQLDTFLAYLPLGDWSVDHTTRRYLQSGRDFVVDGLGTLAPDGVWTWAWADTAAWGQNAAITVRSRRLRAVGESEGIAELGMPRFGLSGIEDAPDNPQDAAEMIAWTAMGLLGARGYIGHRVSEDGSGGRIYYVVCDTTVPLAAPRLDTVPHFLTEGAATFGEDAADCVLGYVERYGWDWSRLPDGGIVVAAEGIGVFTAEITADGELKGVSLRG